MPNDEGQLDDKDWPRVIKAIQNRMKAEHILDAELAHRTRLAPNTISKIWIADSTFNEANLINISIALGWHPYYLINILERRPQANFAFESPAEEAFRHDVLDRLARIDQKIDQILRDQDRPDGSS